MKRKILISILALVILAAAVFLLIPKLKQQLYPREFAEYVEHYSAEYKVPTPLVYAVIYCESSFNKDAESHAGAIGLMQLIPDTLDWLSRVHGEDAPTGEISDPETNIKYGTYYLSVLYGKFGDWHTAVAAYNAGHGRVGGWLSDSRYSDDGITLKNIPYEETSNYVNRVFEIFDEYNNIYFNGEY